MPCIFNNHYTNAASDIGQKSIIQRDEIDDDILCSYQDDTVIRRNKFDVSHENTFSFSPTTVKKFRCLLKINID